MKLERSRISMHQPSTALTQATKVLLQRWRRPMHC